MNFVKPKKWLKTLSSLVGLVGISGAICLPIIARPYYYPPSSFFQPTANYFQSEDELNLVEMLGTLDEFQTLTDKLKVAKLVESLKQEQPITFFAPTDKAFQALPSDIHKKLSQPENLEKVLKYHIFLGLVTEDDIKRGKITTLEGESIQISGTSINDKIVPLLNEAQASEAIKASNGVIVPINSVLIPSNW